MCDLIKELVRRLSEFLFCVLPSLPPVHNGSGDWWNDRVLVKVNPEQLKEIKLRNIKNLEDLDLAVLLTVHERNWKDISTLPGKAFPLGYCAWIKELKDIRKCYAHMSSKGVSFEDKYRQLDTIQRILSYHGSNNNIISSIKSEKRKAFKESQYERNIDLEKSFHSIQRQFLKCKHDKTCQFWTGGTKVSIGNQEKHGICYYNPPPEYIGQKYSGIVVCGLRPGSIREESSREDNEQIRIDVKQFLKSDNADLSKAQIMNIAAKNYIPGFLVSSSIFDYKQWGTRFNLDKIAFLNYCKCRGVPVDGADDVYNRCCGEYFKKQMAILKPKLTIYFYKSTISRISKYLKTDDVGFGGEFCYIVENTNVKKAAREQHRLIKTILDKFLEEE